MMYRHCRIWVGMRNGLVRGFAGVVFAFAQECGLIMRPKTAAVGFKFERHLSWLCH